MSSTGFEAMVATCRQGGLPLIRRYLEILPPRNRLAFIELLVKPVLDDELRPLPPIVSREDGHRLLDEAVPELTPSERATGHVLLDAIVDKHTTRRTA